MFLVFYPNIELLRRFSNLCPNNLVLTKFLYILYISLNQKSLLKTIKNIFFSGYEGDDESCASSCSQHRVRPYMNTISTERCGLPWTTDSSERFVAYPVPQINYKFVDDLKIRKRKDVERWVRPPPVTEINLILNLNNLTIVITIFVHIVPKAMYY